MHPQHAMDQAFEATPRTIGDLFTALPPGHFEKHPDSSDRGREYLAQAKRLHLPGDAERLEGTHNSFYVHGSEEWWVVTGWIHPLANSRDRAHPDSPVVLFARNYGESGLHPLVYGPEVVRLAYRLLGNALAGHAMRGDQMKQRPFNGTVPD